MITVQMGQSGGNSLRPAFELRDASGQSLKTASDCSPAASAMLANYRLPTTGTYVIRASGACDTSGGYTLSVALKPPTKEIAYGSTASGTIAFEDDYEDLRFSGQKGEAITILMVQSGGNSLRPAFELKDSSGSTLKTASDCSSSASARLANYVLPSSGVFTIRAEPGCSSKGGYSLTLSVKAAPLAIAYGGSATGTIRFTEDYEDFLFNGQAGDIVSIRVVRAGGGSLLPGIDLRDSSGSSVKSAGDCSTTDTRIQSVKLPSSGIFTIRVQTACGSSGGAYSLLLSRS